MLTVVTLNINYYVDKHGSWEQRQEHILTALEQARPDIVALQAVRRDPQVAGGIDQAAQLAGRLPGFEHVFFQPALQTPDGGADGSAIISRLPIAERQSIKLTRLDGVEDPNFRVLLHARFDLPGREFHLYDGHFSWVAEQASDNLDEAIPYISSFAGLGLLVGDFNIPSGTPVLERFPRAGWTDAWQSLHPTDPGLTFETDRPTIRIDYAWLNPKLLPHLQGIEIVRTGQEAQGVRLSDHLGLRLTFDLDQ